VGAWGLKKEKIWEVHEAGKECFVLLKCNWKCFWMIFVFKLSKCILGFTVGGGRVGGWGFLLRLNNNWKILLLVFGFWGY
jgi:hypothetical protein